MLDRMSGLELAYWEERDRIEYLGDERGDWQAAMQAANSIRISGVLEDGKTIADEDLMRFLDRDATAVKTEEELAEIDETRQYHARAASAGLAMAEDFRSKALEDQAEERRQQEAAQAKALAKPKPKRKRAKRVNK